MRGDLIMGRAGERSQRSIDQRLHQVDGYAHIREKVGVEANGGEDDEGEYKREDRPKGG